MSAREVSLEINGVAFRRTVEPRLLLSDFIRHEARLTGTNVGCEHGVCGACTVIVDGDAVRSCLMLAVQANGGKVTTVEGLSSDEALSPLQAAFRKHHALQCGFCTPGLLISLSTLFAQDPAPSEAAIREVVGGHLCRCTGYAGILAAALEVASNGNKP